MKFSLKPLCAALTLGLLCLARAQNIPDGIGAAAVTTTDALGRPWAYLRWTAQDPTALQNQRWTIWGRPGTLTDTGNFTYQGMAMASPDPAVIKARLTQAGAIGDDLPHLDEVLGELLEPARWNGPQGVPLEQKISAAMNRAAGDASSAQTLSLLTTGYPAMALVQGEAWAQRLPVAVGQPYTFEVRQAHPTNPTLDGPVLTRLQVTAGQPLILPAAGTPRQICDVSPRGHLAIKLWWPVSADLRKASLGTYGYNLYRLAPSAVAALGTVTPASLRLAVKNGSAKKVNSAPIIPQEAPASAIPVGSTDETTPYYFADDNGVGANPVGTTPFTEGNEFRYFLTARDLLGQEGLVSPAGTGIAISTLPPQPPTDLKVEEVSVPIVPATNPPGFNRQLRLTWTETPSTAPIRTDEYWLYHGVTPSGGGLVPASLVTLDEWNKDATSRAALQACRFKVTAHLNNNTKRRELDTVLPMAAGLMDQAIWFAVQPIHNGPAGCQVKGAPTPAVFGQFRTAEGPPAPDGSASGSCPRVALANFKNEQVEYLSGETALSTDGCTYEAVWNHSSNVAWVEPYLVSDVAPVGTTPVILQGKKLLSSMGRIYFAPDSDLHRMRFTATDAQVAAGSYLLCRTGSDEGAISCWARRTLLSSEDRTRIQVLQFITEGISSGSVDPESWQGKCLLQDSSGHPGNIDCFTPSSGSATVNGVQGIVNISNLPAGAAAAATWEGVCVRNNPRQLIGAVTLTKISATQWSFAASDPAITGPSNIGNYCIALFSEPATVCGHTPRQPASGLILPIMVSIKFGPGVSEYRLFRSLNDDTPSLIKQDAQDFTAANITTIVATDSAMPKAAGTLRYYAQTADKNGNASPLRLIATVPLIIAPPVPVLDQPITRLDASGNAEVFLRWICPPDGIQRFIVRVVPDAVVKDISQNQHPLQDAAPAANALPLQAANLFTAPNTINAAQTLFSESGVAALLKLNETFYTPAPGMQGFSPGPDFNTTVRIRPSGKYSAWVQAVDQNGTPGPKSAIMTFQWKVTPPAAPSYDIPWPARPLPLVSSTAANANGWKAQATVLWSPNNHDRPATGQSLSWPTVTETGDQPCLGVRIGSWLFDAALLGTANITTDNSHIRFLKTRDLNDKLMVEVGPQRGAIMLYRQQIPNPRFTQVSGATIQCSDRVDHIITKVDNPGSASASSVLLDPRIGFAGSSQTSVNSNNGAGGNFSNGPLELQLFLLDQQPQISGATYRYTLVHYRPDGEIAHLYSAGNVTLP